MEKQTIVFCSLLKPITDVRMHEKLANSISALQHYDIHLIGQNILSKNLNPAFFYHPINLTQNGLFNRLKAIFSIFLMVYKLKPKLFVCCTHELLSVGVLTKLFFRSKLIYDVQENYVLNFKSSNTSFFSKSMAFIIKIHEELMCRFYDHFFLAEKCYVEQLNFLKSKRFTLLENKSLHFSNNRIKPKSENINLFFSGTISIEYGIFDAIEWASKWYEKNSKVKLTIVGHVTRRETMKKLIEICSQKSFIEFKGSEIPVPYELIIEAIEQNDIGLLPYQPLPSFERKMPTKLFEYAAMGKLMISNTSSSWSSILIENRLGLATDFKQFNDFEIIEQKIKTFEYPTIILGDFVWAEPEKRKVIEIINRLMLSSVQFQEQIERY